MFENKVVWFLNDRVLAREIWASPYVKGRTTANGAPVRQTLGINAVKAYVAAIVDLWSFQERKGLNPHPNPRGEALNGVLRTRTRGEHRRRRLEFADRATGPCRMGTMRRRWSTPSGSVGRTARRNSRPSRTCAPPSTSSSPTTSCCGVSPVSPPSFPTSSRSRCRAKARRRASR